MVRAQLLVAPRAADVDAAVAEGGSAKESAVANAAGVLTQGGVELVAQWQQRQESFLWLDIVDETPAAEKQLLIDLGFHPLAIQDAQRDRHPPKFEDFEQFSFLLYRGVRTVGDALNIDTVQIAFFVGSNLLVTRRNGPSFGVEKVWGDPHLVKGLSDPALLMSIILKSSAQVYLDAVLEFETRLSEIEDSMSAKPDDMLMQELIGYKSSLRKLRRIFNYHERILEALLKESSNFINTTEEELRHSVQDVYDKFERLQSLTALYYDICGDLIEGYLSISAHKLNRTMQVLTVITAIFIPLGLMAGIYGMNFDHMPELHSANGYYILLFVMFSTAVTLLLMFRRKGWL